MHIRTAAPVLRATLSHHSERPRFVSAARLPVLVAKNSSTENIPHQGISWDPRRAINRLASNGMRAVMDTVKTAERTLLALEGFRSTWVETSIGPVHMLEAGECWDGPTWVFVHGFASQAADWSPLLRTLRQHCGRLLVLDLPGHGRSPVPTHGMTADSLVRASEEAVLAKLGPNEHCVIVGNSMGGLGAIRLAQKYPERVDAQVLLSPAGAPMTDVELDTLINTFNIYSFKTALGFVDKLFINGSNSRFITACGVWAHMGRQHLRMLLEAYRTYPKLQGSELQTMPQTLVIAGDGDNFLPESSRAFFRTYMPAATTRFESNIHFSHTPFLDLSHEIARLILDWAEQHPEKRLIR